MKAFAVLAAGAFLLAAGWAGWEYWRFRACPQSCAPSVTEPPLRLASGGTVRIIEFSEWDSSSRNAYVSYLTDLDLDQQRELCRRQTGEVLDALHRAHRLAAAPRILLVPVNPESQFVGFNGIQPIWFCCRQGSFLLERNEAGQWAFTEAWDDE